MQNEGKRRSEEKGTKLQLLLKLKLKINNEDNYNELIIMFSADFNKKDVSKMNSMVLLYFYK